ncbi:tetratricopeptide repeat protein [Phototrophicus methaneseepsis]|uniref:Tetratricopeptide repeat protein n=1 Tax=Phototrophicus methaneseepsis TaxID=2710758 RepID=A0A7S8IFD6_9CHLR|nr:tetratricopeptide repeat protein [Phototrophicus methaneseepsis]QPC83472.1 tetratricopeptide repeat protein [Phototrophicus methaneseepsis]
MYIRTPKRYRGVQRRSVFSCGRLFFYLIAIVLIGIGVYIYQHREQFQPIVNQAVFSVVSSAESSIGTMTAPTPTPTQDPRNNIAQADNYWMGGSVSEALQLYVPILDSVPNDAEIYSRVTMGSLVQGNYGDALDYAERTITADPFNSEAWVLRSWAQRGQGAPEVAIVSALQALELDRNNADAYAQLAFAYLDNGQADRALTTANRAIELDQTNYNAYRARAYIYWEGIFDFEAAQADLDMAYSLASDQDQAASTLLAIDRAVLQQRLGDLDGAIQTLSDLRQRTPDNTEALYRLGLMYWNQGEFGQAGELMLSCIDVDPTNINCHFWLGRAQNRQEQNQLADQSFQSAIDLGSRNAQHYYWLAVSKQAIGNCNLAYVYWQEGYELAQEDPTQQWVADFEASRPGCAPSDREIDMEDFAVTETPQPDLDPTPDPAGSA